MQPEINIEAFEIFATGVDHPECIAFDRNGDLWAGGEAGQIYRVTPDRKVQQITTMGGFCGGLAFSPQDELFVCNPSLGIVRVKASGEFSVFASHAGDHKMICPNYGVFDSAGNYYVTDSGQFRKNNGYLIRFNPSGKGEILAGPFGYANGLALSADERFLFMVESNTDSVFRFEIRTNRSLIFVSQLKWQDCVGKILPANRPGKPLNCRRAYGSEMSIGGGGIGAAVMHGGADFNASRKPIKEKPPGLLLKN